MSVTISELIKQIEELRRELVNIKDGKAYTDPDVLTASQKLDHVLNEYQKLVEINRKHLVDKNQSVV